MVKAKKGCSAVEHADKWACFLAEKLTLDFAQTFLRLLNTYIMHRKVNSEKVVNSHWVFSNFNFKMAMSLVNLLSRSVFDT